ARLRHYTWGIDKSGTIGGAGGVGGLLMIHQVGGTAGHYMAGYDGNGNFTTLLNVNDGANWGKVEAAYEYSPYGETLRASSIPGESTSTTLATANPFRYSTKYFDEETGTYDYGKRIYILGLGRFLNRESIGSLSCGGNQSM
ncbi:MAG: RHS repeat-associated core domain-containing protein, partial [Verrucomicrobiota bacterium]|nr:RHS repeat-associated core domain-containing protein [Verrucomicrobiota bacterium]